MFLRLATRATIALTTVICSIASAQTPQATVLTIEMENVVRYNENFANPQGNGTSTTMKVQTFTPATFLPATFLTIIHSLNRSKRQADCAHFLRDSGSLSSS